MGERHPGQPILDIDRWKAGPGAATCSRSAAPDYFVNLGLEGVGGVAAVG
jgi:hypothetical protein